MLAAITFLFVDTSGWAASNLDILARMQFIPALLALNVIIFCALIVATLIFGRVYCSVICPLGIYQDVAARFRKLFAGRKRRRVGVYKYKKPWTRTRLIIAGCFILILLLGLLNVMAVSLGALIEPYSAFGRMVTALVSPVWDAGNNTLAAYYAEADTYAVMPVNRSVPAVLFVIALITFVVVTVFAVRTGRGYCNTICPVGTLLGYLSKFSWLKIRIDADKCTSCGLCARHCKSSCIDFKNHAVDYTRCVDCFDCLGSCHTGALKFSAPVKPKAADVETKKADVPDSGTSQGRRMFMASISTLTGAIIAHSARNVIEKTTDGGLTPLKERPSVKRDIKLLPPGVVSQARLNAHCVGCQLCIQACPDGLLTMSTDFATLMQPTIDYTDDYCKPWCSACSNVCPAGVFTPLDEAMKTSWKVGTAKVNLKECISATGTDSCGNCARHCPAGAITMSDSTPDKPIPVVNEAVCIGCGACEVHCPVGTVADMESDRPAIHVEGVSYQRTI